MGFIVLTYPAWFESLRALVSKWGGKSETLRDSYIRSNVMNLPVSPLTEEFDLAAMVDEPDEILESLLILLPRSSFKWNTSCTLV